MTYSYDAKYIPKAGTSLVTVTARPRAKPPGPPSLMMCRTASEIPSRPQTCICVLTSSIGDTTRLCKQDTDNSHDQTHTAGVLYTLLLQSFTWNSQGKLKIFLQCCAVWLKINYNHDTVEKSVTLYSKYNINYWIKTDCKASPSQY